MLTYTNIQHTFRKEHGLSCNEYVLCDMIFFLSSQKESEIPGWCYMTKERMAEEVGMTKQSILTMIERMITAGFLAKNDVTKYLRTTAKWQQVYFTTGKETLPEVKKTASAGKETLPEVGKETLPNNNSSNNNTDNINNDVVVGAWTDEERKLFSDVKYQQWSKDTFRKMCEAIKGRKLKNGKIYSAEEMEDFFEIWTQIMPSGNYKYREASSWSWLRKLQNYSDTQKRIDSRNTLKNGATINQASVNGSGVQSNVAAVVGTKGTTGTSAERIGAAKSGFRRSQVGRGNDEHTDDRQAGSAGNYRPTG